MGGALALLAIPLAAFALAALLPAPVPRVEAAVAAAARGHASPDAGESPPDVDEGDEPALTRLEQEAEPTTFDGEIEVPRLVTRGRRPPRSGPNVLRLRASADGDTVEVVPFDDTGAPEPEAFAAISYVMRLRLTGARREIHPRLVEILVRISRRWEDRYVRLQSGYREVGQGTLATSYHTRGMAADIRVRGVPAEELYRVATEVGAFGVGIYPHDGFVHIDVRDVPHRWEQDLDGANVPREHPSRWRLTRRFRDLLAIGALPEMEAPPEPNPRLPRRCSGVRPPDRGPFDHAIALTFDDGPSRHTPRILEVLRSHRAPATFFVTGEVLDAHADVLASFRRERAFDVGNHTLTHADLSELDRDALEDEVERAAARLAAHDLDATFFRFPYGRSSCEAAALVRNRGYPIAGWHIDSADWCFARGDGRCRDTERFGEHIHERDLSEHVLAQARERGGGIVLFHDDVELTANELDDVLTALEDDGFRFVSLSDEVVFPKLNERIARARARRLGLGTRRAATRLTDGDVERAWRAAAGGVNPPRTLEWPVENAVAARGYGSGEGGYHQAVDISHSAGSEVHSVADGIVGYAGDELPNYGNTVIVIHPGGLVSFYAHNRENLVRAGQLVTRGATIARLGDSGLARGPHVHFELLYDGRVCDPAPLFRPLPVARTGPIEGLDPVEWVSASEAPVECAERRRHPRSRWTR